MSHCIRSMARNRRAFSPGLLLLVILACLIGLVYHAQAQAPDPNRQWPQAPLTIQNGAFVDAAGRQVILNGINLVDKDPGDGFNVASAALFGQFRAWGFNCVRLGILWAGVEPEPGKYNEPYLAQVDQCIQWASQNKIFVILDLNQLLFGTKYRNGYGAPNWAIVDDDKKASSATVPTDAYFNSEAVQAAFSSFWSNKPAPDKKGILDHYVDVWQLLARRYANQPYVLGYDLLHDPYMGSEAKNVLPLFLEQYIVILAEGGKEPGEIEAVERSFDDEFGRVEGIRPLDAADKYSRVIDPVEELHKKFETQTLQPVYQRLADTIRAVDPTHVLFLEHGYFCNFGVRSAIRPTTKGGQPDPQVAYAPHALDLLTGTKGMADISPERITLVMSRFQENGKQWGTPTVVGDWGFFQGVDPMLVDPARAYLERMDQSLMGNIYSEYVPDISKLPYFQDAVLRPYPVCVAGRLQKCAFEPKTNTLEVDWQESEQCKLPTAIYIPDRKLLKTQQVTLEPKARKVTLWYWPSMDIGYLLVYPDPGNKSRKLKVPYEKKQLAERPQEPPAAAPAKEQPAAAAPAKGPAAKEPAAKEPAPAAEPAAAKPPAPPAAPPEPKKAAPAEPEKPAAAEPAKSAPAPPAKPAPAPPEKATPAEPGKAAPPASQEPAKPASK